MFNNYKVSGYIRIHGYTSLGTQLYLETNLKCSIITRGLSRYIRIHGYSRYVRISTWTVKGSRVLLCIGHQTLTLPVQSLSDKLLQIKDSLHYSDISTSQFKTSKVCDFVLQKYIGIKYKNLGQILNFFILMIWCRETVLYYFAQNLVYYYKCKYLYNKQNNNVNNSKRKILGIE